MYYIEPYFPLGGKPADWYDNLEEYYKWDVSPNYTLSWTTVSNLQELVNQDEKEFNIKLALPGVKKEDLDLEVLKDT